MDIMQNVIDGEFSLQKEQAPEVLQDAEAYKMRLRQDPAVQNLTSEIDVNDINTILQFGSKPGMELARMSDELLNTLTVPTDKDALEMLTQLAKIMKKFDMKELKDAEVQNPGLFKRLANKFKNELDALIAKYDNLGKDVDKIFTIIKQYEQETYKDNEKLTWMYHQNLQAYQDYQRYVVAAELAKEELVTAKTAVDANMDMSEYERNAASQQLDLMIRTLENRTVDMLGGGVVAQTTVPMLLNMQQANVELLRKYHTAFTIGIPIFKNNLTQVILLKRQAIRAKSMNEFEDALREQLQANAERTAAQSVAIARQANTATFSFEDLERAYNTVSQGNEAVQRAIMEADAKREEDKKKLEQLQQRIKTESK